MSDPVAIPRKDKAKARAGGSHTPTTRPPPTMAMPTPSSHAFNYYDHRLSPASIDSCLNMTPSSQSPTPISARDKGKGPIRNGSIGMSRSVSGESNSPWTERRMSLLSKLLCCLNCDREGRSLIIYRLQYFQVRAHRCQRW